MPKKIVIVESPTKTKPIQGYLGSEYKVFSSKGHIRNLSQGGKMRLGVDLNTFEPLYKIDKDKLTIVNELKKVSKNASKIYLATDPDREGEAIAYHLKEVLGPNLKYSRVRFKEITKSAIVDAINSESDVDMDLVRAQETRRILDRFIGFRLSKFLKEKIRSKSAGRVQSIALKYIVDLEKDRNNFQKEEYWTIEGEYHNQLVKLKKYNNKKVVLNSQEDMMNVAKELDPSYLVQNIDCNVKWKHPRKPYTTSTLLQDASNKLNFSLKRTSILAQQLYEGVKINGEHQGLITYPRTDSTRVSNKFWQEAKNFIVKTWGDNYFNIKEINYSEIKKQNTQDAHEAIRPTDIYLTVEKVKKYLSRDQLKVYTLIYNRSLAALMTSAKLDAFTVELMNNGYQFSMNYNKIIFPGFLKVQDPNYVKDNQIPTLTKGLSIKLDKLEGIQHFTQPISRFTEAKLIKKLEDAGIGRPSTYSGIISTLQDRGYVILDAKTLKPTEKGVLTSDTLQDWFSEIINEHYTSEIETQLDDIANGRLIPKTILKKFWTNFQEKILFAFEKMEPLAVESANIECPKCGSDLVYRHGKYGKFIACSSFPKCRYIHQEDLGLGKCPLCKEGDVLIKINKKRQKFLSCSLYSDTNCGYISEYNENKTKKDTPKNIHISIIKN